MSFALSFRLPSRAAVVLHDLLGFTRLMDLRCLSCSVNETFEQAALRWMERHLPKTQQRLKAELVAARAQLRRLASAPPQQTVSSADAMEVEGTTPHVSVRAPVLLPAQELRLPSFVLFNLADAVWLRQMLSRWRFLSYCEDTDGCVISRFHAGRAYEEVWFSDVLRSSKKAGLLCVRVIELAGRVLEWYGHAALLQKRYRREGWEGGGYGRLQGFARDETAQRRKAEWEDPTTGQPLFALLPSAVTVHSILPHLDVGVSCC